MLQQQNRAVETTKLVVLLGCGEIKAMHKQKKVTKSENVAKNWNFIE